MSARRVLVAFAGGRGHLLPMLPLARALRDAGHTLAVSGHRAAAADHGVFTDVLPHARVPGEGAAPDGGTGTLVRPDLEHELTVVGRWYAGTLALRNAARTAAVIDTWRPDLLVVDEMDFGSIAAAERACLPVVVVDVIASGALTRRPYVDAGLARLRAELGLTPSPDLAWTRGDLEVCPFPPGLRGPGAVRGRSVLAVRPEAADVDGAHPALAWLDAHPGPCVYVTLGTIFNTESGDLFARVLGGLDGLVDADGGAVARVLVTVGADVDPAQLGRWPEHVRVERFVPQEPVLRRVDVVVNHAGSGSLTGALAHGLPVVVLPLGADQELNADRVRALGAGRVLDPVTATPDAVRRAVLALLVPDAPERAGARAVRGQVEALPRVAWVLDRVEALIAPPAL